jgi:DNA-binding transcriptional regulator WhiA
MALTAQVKDELARFEVTRVSARKAEVTSILRFSSALHLTGGAVLIESELDTAGAPPARGDPGALRPHG